MQQTTVGIFVGLILGLAFAIDGLDGLIAAAFFGIAGYVVARVLQESDVDLGQYLSGRRDEGETRPPRPMPPTAP